MGVMDIPRSWRSPDDDARLKEEHQKEMDAKKRDRSTSGMRTPSPRTTRDQSMETSDDDEIPELQDPDSPSTSG